MRKYISLMFIFLLFISQNIYADSNDWLDSSKSEIENNYKYSDYNIDFGKIKQKWLDLNNNLRRDLWKSEYTYHSKLDETAQEWSETSKDRGEISHKRDKKDSYYNYNKILKWFKKREVVCENVKRITFSESIWYGNYSCSEEDCTSNLENGIEKIFNMYLKEKDKSYRPHYKALVSDQFKTIWLWLSITELKKNSYKFFLTVHYCTGVVE
jgi:hypothetical protein